MRVDRYDDQDDLTEYLQHFETVAERNQWRWRSTYMAMQLPKNLIGPARMVHVLANL